MRHCSRSPASIGTSTRTQLERFEQRHRRDLVASFRRHADAGRLELITSGATHGFLPLMQDRPEAVRAQIAIGREAHRRALGRDPTGIWLPECGYFPGLEEVLAEEGLRYFFLESHGLLWGSPPPPGGVHLPVYTSTGVAAFARDPESSQQVWSAEVGFPGHPDYREFHRDLGFELPWEDIGPWMLATGHRRNTGFRYHRVTGPGPDKALYDPARAAAVAKAHAREFVESRARQLAALQPQLGDAALVVAPYDAELFGHWWFEGPLFLEEVLRLLAAPPSTVRAVTPPEYLKAFPAQALCTPAESSWGREGHASTWLDPVNDWIQGEVSACADVLVELATRHRAPTPLESRALAQAARELLLAQSSDWAFILRAGTTLEYATRRVREHVDAFRRLAGQLEAGVIDPDELERRESRANPFPWLDATVYARRDDVA